MTETLYTLKELLVFCGIAVTFGCAAGFFVMALLSTGKRADRFIDEQR